MLVILSFALVLVAVVLLVLGLLTTSGLALIYASMACSLAAGIVLYIAIRLGRPQVQEAPAGVAPAGEPATSRAAMEASTERAVASTASEREAAGTVAVLEREEPPEAEEAAPEPTRRFAAEEVEEGFEEEPEEEFFPIADYDELTVAELMPLLPELYPEELDEVEEHERATKSRVTVLNRIADLREELRVRGAEEEWGVPEEGWAERPEPPAVGFPIPDYDDLTAVEIRNRLSDLDVDELEQVRDREESGAGRLTILREVDRQLEREAAPARRKAPTKKKAAKKKAAAKRAAKKKAAAKGVAKNKAAAKRTGGKRAGGKKAGGKKAAKKRATAKKSAKRSGRR